jgi:hypothetical protein
MAEWLKGELATKIVSLSHHETNPLPSFHGSGFLTGR